MACKDETPYPDRWRNSRAVPLAYEFELIREAAGGLPLRVGSAYRTESWNRKVGGSARSQHVQGRALDIYPSRGNTNVDLLLVVMDVARRGDSKIKGIGLYPWGVHVDIRPGTRLARWGGSRKAAELVRNA
jgi:uncharacterized protein YcbK (DUF882 family)